MIWKGLQGVGQKVGDEFVKMKLRGWKWRDELVRIKWRDEKLRINALGWNVLGCCR